jgi:hypothetical protein
MMSLTPSFFKRRPPEMDSVRSGVHGCVSKLRNLTDLSLRRFGVIECLSFSPDLDSSRENVWVAFQKKGKDLRTSTIGHLGDP